MSRLASRYRGIEAVLEAELEGHVRCVDLGRHRHGALEVRGKRLLAERRQTPTEALADERHVGVRSGGDDHRVGRIESLLRSSRRAGTDIRGDGRGTLRDVIGDHQLVDTGRTREDAGVHLADPACSE